MHPAKFMSLWILASALAAAPVVAHAQAPDTLFRFTKGTGWEPNGSYVMDSAGSIYGTANRGGPSKCGTIFKFVPATQTLTVLHKFVRRVDGCAPAGGLVADKAGLLYGAATYNMVFRFDPKTAALTVLHKFTGGADGDQPLSEPIFGADGKLYGTTSSGGSGSGSGTIYQIDPASGAEKIVFSFSSRKLGEQPSRPLTLGASGLLYGVTPGGGTGGNGVAFSFDPATSSETILYNFSKTTGPSIPVSNVAFGPDGLLYGTTNDSLGKQQVGIVYSLDPASGVAKTLYGFPVGYFGGNSVVVDSAGYIYTSTYQPTSKAPGVVLKINPTTGAGTTLASFDGGVDGGGPGGLVLLQDGGLYGAAFLGGNFAKRISYGTMFEVSH